MVDSDGLEVHLRRDGLNEWFLAVPSESDKLGFRAGSNSVDQEKVTFMVNGNVGIGTSNPGEALTVAGTIETSSGGVKFPDSTIQTTAVNGREIVTALSPTQNGTGTQTAIANCPTGKSVIGGGGRLISAVITPNASALDLFNMTVDSRYLSSSSGKFAQIAWASTCQKFPSAAITLYVNSHP